MTSMRKKDKETELLELLAKLKDVDNYSEARAAANLIDFLNSKINFEIPADYQLIQKHLAKLTAAHINIDVTRPPGPDFSKFSETDFRNFYGLREPEAKLPPPPGVIVVKTKEYNATNVAASKQDNLQTQIAEADQKAADQKERELESEKEKQEAERIAQEAKQKEEAKQQEEAKQRDIEKNKRKESVESWIKKTEDSMSDEDDRKVFKIYADFWKKEYVKLASNELLELQSEEHKLKLFQLVALKVVILARGLEATLPDIRNTKPRAKSDATASHPNIATRKSGSKSAIFGRTARVPPILVNSASYGSGLNVGAPPRQVTLSSIREDDTAHAAPQDEKLKFEKVDLLAEAEAKAEAKPKTKTTTEMKSGLTKALEDVKKLKT